MKFKTLVWRMKDDAFPELTPEHRETIIGAEEAMCEMNAEYGYKQGLRAGLITGGIGLAAGCIATAVTCIKLNKKQKSETEKKKD